MAIGHHVVYRLMQWLGARSCAASPEQRIAIGTRIGLLMMWMDPKRRRLTLDNIQQAFPERSSAEHRAIMRGSYENMGITLVEMLAIPVMEKAAVQDRMKIVGCERVRERLAQGLPCLLVSGHFGNWEYLALAAGIEMQVAIHMVVHPQSNEELNRELNASRSKFGNVVVTMHHAARTLVHALTHGGVVAFLADQHARPDKDPWVTFFGRPTPTYEAPAALALRFQAPIFYAFAVRQPDGRYIATIEELPMDDLGTDQESIIELTRRHVHVLEQAVARHPHLWSWQHRRWRGQPPTTAHDGNRYAHTTTIKETHR